MQYQTALRVAFTFLFLFGLAPSISRAQEYVVMEMDSGSRTSPPYSVIVAEVVFTTGSSGVIPQLTPVLTAGPLGASLPFYHLRLLSGTTQSGPVLVYLQGTRDIGLLSRGGGQIISGPAGTRAIDSFFPISSTQVLVARSRPNGSYSFTTDLSILDITTRRETAVTASRIFDGKLLGAQPVGPSRIAMIFERGIVIADLSTNIFGSSSLNQFVDIDFTDPAFLGSVLPRARIIQAFSGVGDRQNIWLHVAVETPFVWGGTRTDRYLVRFNYQGSLLGTELLPTHLYPELMRIENGDLVTKESIYHWEQRSPQGGFPIIREIAGLFYPNTYSGLPIVTRSQNLLPPRITTMVTRPDLPELGWPQPLGPSHPTIPFLTQPQPLQSNVTPAVSQTPDLFENGRDLETHIRKLPILDQHGARGFFDADGKWREEIGDLAEIQARRIVAAINEQPLEEGRIPTLRGQICERCRVFPQISEDALREVGLEFDPGPQRLTAPDPHRFVQVPELARAFSVIGCKAALLPSGTQD